jgi:hypothetical protein
LIAAQVGLLSVAATVLAAPVHADEQSYIQYLNEHGYTGVYFGGLFHPRNTIVLGHAICNDLHSGGTPELQQVKWWMLPQLPLAREAARRELCPDTLD